MDLKTIANNSSYFTDENFTDTMLISFANKAISRINVEVNGYFPDFVDMSTEYTALPKKWLMSLVSPYMSYGIKMNDTSLTEAHMYLEEFTLALKKFTDSLGALVEVYEKGDTINGISPDMIEDEGFGGAFSINTDGAIDKGWFGNSSNGGSF